MAQPPAQVKDLLTILNELASFDLAESWDNVGLLVGNPETDISGVMVGLDPTMDLLEEAVSARVNTVVTHHPLIFHPLTALRTDQLTGKLIKKAIDHQLTVIGCHTNLDVVPGGVNDVFAESLGLKNFEPVTGEESDIGFGRIGNFPETVTVDAFLKKLSQSLDVKTLRIAGPLPEKIKTVAVCGGSGSDLAEQAFKMGAQVFISGEIKHSIARWAESSGFCIIDAGHFATENLIVPALVDALTKQLTKKGLRTDILSCSQQKNPFRSLVIDKGKINIF